MSLSHPSISVVLLAGGQGTRMQAKMPKQFMKLHDKEVALFSFEQFNQHPWVEEIIVVCDSAYHCLFKSVDKKVFFAKPGKTRQESSLNGFKKIKQTKNWVAIHDAARPYLGQKDLDEVFKQAQVHGAAALGVLSSSTLKEADDQLFIKKTVNRNQIWLIQTPQVIRWDLLNEGFKQAALDQVQVTDDVSLIEHLGQPVKIVPGSLNNIKLTHPSDWKVLESVLLDEVYA